MATWQYYSVVIYPTREVNISVKQSDSTVLVCFCLPYIYAYKKVVLLDDAEIDEKREEKKGDRDMKGKIITRWL